MAINGINVPFLGKTILQPGVSGLNLTGLPILIGNISIIPSGMITGIYSGNNIVLGVLPQITGLSITGQPSLINGVALIPSGITQMAYSGNNIVIGTPPRSIGELWVSGNATATIIPTTRNFFRVSGFSRTGAAMVNFTMTNSGELTYLGQDTFIGVASVMGNLDVGGGATIATSFLQNGNAIRTISRTFGIPGAGTIFSAQTTVILAPNDTISFAVANQGGTQNPTIEDYNFVVR